MIFQANPYNLKWTNNRRVKYGFEELTKSFYHCQVCGDYNNPFNYFGAEFEEVKEKNICEKRKKKPPKDFYE